MNFKKKYLVKWIFLLICIVSLISCSRGDSSSSEQTESQRYNAAKQAYNTQQYNNAISGFNQQLAAFPNGSLADNALLYLGRSHYWLSEYTTAASKFLLILSDYQLGDRLDGAQYWLGKTYHAQALVSPVLDQSNYVSPFIAARTAYQAVTGVAYIDNAAYQIGRTHLDEAMLLSKPNQALAVTNFEMAIDGLSNMILTYSAATTVSSSIDDAQFYLGRSYHEFAVLVQKDAVLSTMLASDIFISAHVAYTSIQIPNTSSYADDAQYFDARAYHDQDDFVNARLGYGSIVDSATGNWLDDAQYQIAKTYYDAAVAEPDLQIAVETFIVAITEYTKFAADPSYALSSRQDDAAFFKGRSYHRQAAIVAAGTLPTGTPTVTAAEFFLNARNTYQSLIANFASSGWRDNAQYQIGAAFFDESQLALAIPDYPLMQQHLSDAIQAFAIVTTDSTLQLLNSADNAQYYLGRSYHRIADLALIEPTVPLIDFTATKGINLTQVTHQTARDEYQKLITDPIFSNSTWKDNAIFRQGKSFVAEANIELAKIPTPDADVVVLAYNNALTQFDTLINSYTGSNRIDNAAYNIGQIYHDTCYRDQEILWFDFVVNYSASSTLLIDKANKLHLKDIIAGNHPTCPATSMVDKTHTPPSL